MNATLCDPTTLAAASDVLAAGAREVQQAVDWSQKALTVGELWIDVDHGEVARWFHRGLAEVSARARMLGDACAHTGTSADLADCFLGRLGGPSIASSAPFDLGVGPSLDIRGPSLLAGELCASALGDPGGTGISEARTAWSALGARNVDRNVDWGRAVLIQALRDTANSCQIGPDEIGLVQTGDRWVLVLPGVTDLSDIAEWTTGLPSGGRSKPSPWGLNRTHRSVRDTDAVARRSATSAGLADNEYAALVATLVAERVPVGAEIAIVGHSAGADTALDLAADPRFNGPGRYSVTHVAAFAYYSQPVLPAVPAGTKVLAVENGADLVVRAEHALSTPNRMLQAALTAADGDVGGGRRRLEAAIAHGAAQLTDGAVLIGSTVVDDLAAGRVPDLNTMVANTTRSTRPTRDQTHIVFKGDTSEAGHHQRHYIDFLQSATGTAGVDLDEFAADLADAGYAVGGPLVAIDVSVPEQQRPAVNPAAWPRSTSRRVRHDQR